MEAIISGLIVIIALCVPTILYIVLMMIYEIYISRKGGR